jgi:hypothetical protein
MGDFCLHPACLEPTKKEGLGANVECVKHAPVEKRDDTINVQVEFLLWMRVCDGLAVYLEKQE